jgi:ferredoxin
MLDAIADAVAEFGLSVRGAVSLFEGEWENARSVVLVGNDGASYWTHFERWRQMQPANIASPLDTWSRTMIAGVAKRFGGRVQMPNDKPYAPFQRWAMRAQTLRPSPVGLLIHPEYGLWHAFRGAIVFDDNISIQVAETVIHACDACHGKPCVKACPVHAFDGEEFDYQACLACARARCRRMPHPLPCQKRVPGGSRLALSAGRAGVSSKGVRRALIIEVTPH